MNISFIKIRLLNAAFLQSEGKSDVRVISKVWAEWLEVSLCVVPLQKHTYIQNTFEFDIPVINAPVEAEVEGAKVVTFPHYLHHRLVVELGDVPQVQDVQVPELRERNIFQWFTDGKLARVAKHSLNCRHRQSLFWFSFLMTHLHLNLTGQL